MKVTFVDEHNVALPASADIGGNNNIVIGIVIDPEGSTSNIAGEIFHNSNKIGDFKWSVAEGTVSTWFMGEGRPIYVKNGDVIKATTTTPSVQTTSLAIVRYQPNFNGMRDLAKITDNLKAIAPNQKGIGRIKQAVNVMSQNANISYNNRTDINILNLTRYGAGQLELPPTKSYIFGNTSDLNNALSTLKPPSALDIFNTWARFSANNYYTDPATIPPESEAAAWYWDDARQAAVMPLNSSTFLGFVSDELVDFYDHEALMKSGSADDDWNGLILAFVYKDGICYSLSATACRDGRNGAGDQPAVNLNLRYNWGTVLANNNNNNERGGGWVNQRKWIKVSRRGDQFYVYFSRWNSDTYDPELTMTINLNDDPRLAIFKGPQRYGYCNISQADSTFNNIKYLGGILRDTIVDASTNRVYRYSVTNGWQLLPGVTAQAVYGAPRVLSNPDDGKSYLLNVDGTITSL